MHVFCFYVHWPRGHPGGLPDVCSVYMGMQERRKGKGEKNLHELSVVLLKLCKGWKVNGLPNFFQFKWHKQLHTATHTNHRK